MRYRTATVLVVHGLLFAFSFFCSFCLIYNFKNFSVWVNPFYVPLLPIVLALRIAVFGLSKQYRGSWRYVGMRDFWAVFKAAWFSSFLFVLAFAAMEWLPNWLMGLPGLISRRTDYQFPQAIFLLDLGMCVATVCGARILVRLYYEEVRPVSSAGRRRCLIVGAGDTGEALLREVQRMPVDRYQVIGFPG
jgi:FlaA1/EpsC-like NDP-sugar epimerase